MVSSLSTIAQESMRFHGQQPKNDKDKTTNKHWIQALAPSLSALYALGKVRGRKRIQTFLPHRVQDVQIVWSTLERLQVYEDSASVQEEEAKDDAGHIPLWESTYVLWSWMGMLSLVPFDSTVVLEQVQVDALLAMARKDLAQAGPTREVAAACLAGWLARSELEATALPAFLVWAQQELEDYQQEQQQHQESGRSSIFLILGVLQTLVTFWKVSKAERSSLLEWVTPLRPVLAHITESQPSNWLLRKYLVKWWTRTGTIYLPPRIASWRYQRGRRSLEVNLQSAHGTSGNRVSTPDTGDTATTVTTTATDDCNPQEDEWFLVPDPVEDTMGHILSALTDSSTVVRWSAAKGVGRLVERLPHMCAEDVLDALLQLFEDREKDNDWHGGCLALAELARRGLLLPNRLPMVLPVVAQAIHYDVPRRQTSVGAHVRDAACYTYWAIARAYSPAILNPYVLTMSQSLVTAFLFDREVNCRRAASAAFQEFVGRQGAKNFRHGIDILTTADYFSLGNRTEAYLSIAVVIANYDEYKLSLVNHLYQSKLSHWDPKIRTLTASALGKLTVLCKDHMLSVVLPFLLEHSLDERNVALRHGCVLSLAEIVLALGSMDQAIDELVPEALLLQVTELIPALEKKRLYRGKGGEQIRGAVCRQIECISLAKIPLKVPQQVRMLDSVDASIPHPNETIQQQACNALHALTRSYFPVGVNGPSDRLQKRVVDNYVSLVKTSTNPAKTRGFSMALGSLPAKLLAPSSKVLDLSLACLCRASRPDATVGNEKDAETKRNALTALSKICQTVGVGPVGTNSGCIVSMTEKQVSHVLTAMLRGLTDYHIERRGDIGSMSRIAAMQGLLEFAKVGRRANVMLGEEDTGTKMVGGMLKQLAEKLDSVRREAGQCLEELLKLIPDNANGGGVVIPESERLSSILAIHDNHTVNWADASETFPLLVRVLDIEAYFSHVASGIVISVGCLTQNVAKAAGESLITWMKQASKEQIGHFGQVILSLLETHRHDGRVILPLLKTMVLLSNRLCIDTLLHDKAFAAALLTCLKEEERGCQDIHRLTCLVEVSLALSCEENGLEEHSFPRIRRIAAENLYMVLQEKRNVEEALDLLLTSPWDGDLEAKTVGEWTLDVAAKLGSTISLV
eukprot:Nitzschia sp. Nitz4//scaffold179_size51476//40380//44226//NITZ4_006931-RA/size51476-processed-gene-0.18-mRNA-1//-1//CDS//3329539231//9133//frame0